VTDAPAPAPPWFFVVSFTTIGRVGAAVSWNRHTIRSAPIWIQRAEVLLVSLVSPTVSSPSAFPMMKYVPALAEDGMVCVVVVPVLVEPGARTGTARPSGSNTSPASRSEFAEK